MHILNCQNSAYRSSPRQPSLLRSVLPTTFFYCELILIISRAAWRAKQGKYDGTAWANSSYEVFKAIEKIGVQVEVTGIEHLVEHKQPLVIIGNHMSMMETLLVPTMIQPLMDVTFVVKESLLNYPIFKYVMRSRNPVAVSRTNPRQDLKTVMVEGVDRLNRGTSVIVFPQTTRSSSFDPKQMSSIGVKLAKKAGVAVIPLALKTDGWQNGKRMKDFGKIDTSRTAHFAFGKALEVKNRGAEEQQVINDFIVGKLESWRR